jgi:hypothetical protein
MAVRLYKMARVECDGCAAASFDVYTYEESVEAPPGWKVLVIWAWVSRTDHYILCCPSCVTSRLASDKHAKVHDEMPLVTIKEGWSHDD